MTVLLLLLILVLVVISIALVMGLYDEPPKNQAQADALLDAMRNVYAMKRDAVATKRAMHRHVNDDVIDVDSDEAA